MSDLPMDHAPTVHEQGLKLLTVINEAIISESTELGLLKAVAQPLQTFANADHVGIVRIHEVSGAATLVAEHPPTPMLGTELPDDSTNPTAILRRTRGDLLIDDVTTSPIISDDLRQILLQVGARSLLLLPLVDAQNALIGSIGFDFGAPHALPDSTRLDYLRVVIVQVAAAVMRLRLQVQSQRHADQLQKINAYTRRIPADTELAQALQIVLDSARALEPFDYVALYLRRGDQAHLQQAALWRDGAATITPEGRRSEDGGSTPYHEAFLDAAPIIVHDLATDPAWNYPQAAGIRSLVAYPLIMQTGPFGVLELGSAQPHAYNSAAFNIFQQFANETALLLSNVLAYRRAQRQLSVKARAAELTMTIQQQTEMDAIIKTTLQALTTAFGASRARIRLGVTPDEKKG
ncbi:GAF domain-containing protein [Aggregatilineales bacterium SYSU G02658]